jgi:hypothetical protein
MNCVTFRFDRRGSCGDIAFNGLKTLPTKRAVHDRNLARSIVDSGGREDS